MTRKARWSVPPGQGSSELPRLSPDAPADVVRKHFSRHLWTLVVGKGWNQSELARAAGISRDSVSGYIRGETLPDPKNLQKMADALGITIEQLNPMAVQAGHDSDNTPSIELKDSASKPGLTWLRVNKEVPFDIAVQILQLLKTAEA